MTIAIKDATSATVNIAAPNANGQALALNSAPVVLASDQSAVAVDTVIKASETDRGLVIGFTGAQFTLNSTNLVTLTTAPTSGGIIDGQVIAATGITPGTTLLLASGARNAISSTYTLSAAATATAAGVAATSMGPQQIMAANSARRGFETQNQTAGANVWISAIAAATADFHSRRIDPGLLYESPSGHCPISAISAIADAPATPLYVREY